MRIGKYIIHLYTSTSYNEVQLGVAAWSYGSFYLELRILFWTFGMFAMRRYDD